MLDKNQLTSLLNYEENIALSNSFSPQFPQCNNFQKLPQCDNFQKFPRVIPFCQKIPPPRAGAHEEDSAPLKDTHYAMYVVTQIELYSES